MRRWGTMGCCEAGLVAGGAAAWVLGGADAVAAGGCACGGVTTTAGGVADFSAAGGAAGAAGLAAGGVTKTVFSGAGLGFSTTGVGAATTGGLTGAGATTAGLDDAGGCCCCFSFSRSRRITSPGLEILERSSLGLTSVAEVLSRDAAPDLEVIYFLTSSASSTSRELEWVFFAVTPTSGKTSRMALAFTSSSLAKSLIRIFIRSAFPPTPSRRS